MDTIRRPARIFVTARAMGKLNKLVWIRYVHYKNVKVAGLEPPGPCESDLSAIGIPAGIDRVSFAISQTGDIGAVNTHSIYLGSAAAAGGEDDIRTGLGIHFGFYFDGPGVGDTPQPAAVDIGHEDLGEAAGGGRVDQKMPVVRHEVGGGVHGGLLIVVNQL